MLEQEANSGEFIMKGFFVLASLICLQTGNLLSSDIKWSSEAKREAYEREFAQLKEERIAKYRANCKKLEGQVADCIKGNNYKGTFVLSIFDPMDKFEPPEFEPRIKVIELAELDNDLSDAEIKNMEDTFDNYFDKIYPGISGVMKIDFMNRSSKWYTLWSRYTVISYVCS
jgi:hypothetical protein